MSLHTGGSKAAIDYEITLAAEKGEDETVEAYELFECLHTTKEGRWIDQRSENIANKYKDHLAAATQENNGAVVDKTQLFVDVATTKKKIVYGVGSRGAAYVGRSSATLGVENEPMRIQIEEQVRAQVQAEMQAERESYAAERAELQAQLQTQAKKHATMEAQIVSVFQALSKQGIYIAPPVNDVASDASASIAHLEDN